MVGQTVGHYAIEKLLGEGGMGVVYLARDIRLNRPVAIKFLPPGITAGAERPGGFVEEARAASALRHANIVTIYDVNETPGEEYIVMEYVPGRTLDQVIPPRGLRLSDALKYAIPIAGALAAAHAAGIVHRDIKPANIVVGDDGVVKLLDFGLAKPAPPQPAFLDATMTAVYQTEEGSLTGTVSYMSPEQAEGKPLDARSDIFSFGALLYEMVTGRKAFEGDSRIAILTSILHKQPAPASRQAEGLPRELDRIIGRCLRKDPERRFQNMADCRVALLELKEEHDSGSLEGEAIASPAASRARSAPWIAAAAACSLGVAGTLLWLRGTDGPESGMANVPRPAPLTSFAGAETSPSFGPDGNVIAFAWNGPPQDNFDIYLQMIGGGNPVRVTSDPARDSDPAWSPDGRWIGFLRDSGQRRLKLFTVPPLGGSEKEIAETHAAPGFLTRLAWSWTPDSSSLVFWDWNERKLVAVPVAGGERVVLLDGNEAPGMGQASAFSPDGKHFAISSFFENRANIHLFGYESGKLAPKGSRSLGIANEVITSMTFTPDSTELILGGGPGSQMYRFRPFSSDPAEAVGWAGERATSPAFSRDGKRFAYVVQTATTSLFRQDLSKPSTAIETMFGSTRSERAPAYSPDGRSLAFWSDRSGSGQIWVADSGGTNARAITSYENERVGVPAWSPDSAQVAFMVSGRDFTAIDTVVVKGGKQRRLGQAAGHTYALAWSKDGKRIYVHAHPKNRLELWVYPVDGSKPFLFAADESQPLCDTEDGKELFVETGRSLWVVSKGGRSRITGERASVAHCGKEGIYFVGEDRSLRFWSFESRTARVLTEAPQQRVQSMAVSPDGRYVMYALVEQEGSDIMIAEGYR